MKIPLKPSMLKIRRGKPRWIILHHTEEIYENPMSKIDNSKYQFQGITTGVVELKQSDVNYHYIIEKIQDDYRPIVCRPLVYLCDWDDIDPNINNRAIHIAFLGSYDFIVPPKRLYEILAFRLLNPMLKMYNLTFDKIKLHKEVSSNNELTCPGDFIEMEVIDSMIRRFNVK